MKNFLTIFACCLFGIPLLVFLGLLVYAVVVGNQDALNASGIGLGFYAAVGFIAVLMFPLIVDEFSRF